MVSPGKVLAFNAIGAIALILISTNTSGHVAAYSLLLIGLMNSIMFPTIFSLACEGLGPRPPMVRASSTSPFLAARWFRWPRVRLPMAWAALPCRWRCPRSVTL
jgi:fucose permease